MSFTDDVRKLVNSVEALSLVDHAKNPKAAITAMVRIYENAEVVGVGLNEGKQPFVNDRNAVRERLAKEILLSTLSGNARKLDVSIYADTVAEGAFDLAEAMLQVADKYRDKDKND